MKNINIALLVTWLMIGSSCEDQIDTYSGPSYIYFRDTVINYSFAYNPNDNSRDIPFRVKLIGDTTAYDREIQLEVTYKNEHIGEDDYELLPAKLRRGRVLDTVYVRVNNSPKTKDHILSLKLSIKANEHFMPGPTRDGVSLLDSVATKTTTLHFSDRLLQPVWWDKAIEKDYLGTYSEKKYRHLIIATGISDLTGMQGSEKRAYARAFQNYIRENNLTEEDGSPMIVPVK